MATRSCLFSFSQYLTRQITRSSVIRRVPRRYVNNVSDRTPNKGPLAGYRVLDLTRILAGPYCTMILGDHGAEVIKIESPNFGDDTRRWGPPFIKGESTYFMSINRNKKSIAVNLKSPEGAKIVRELIKESDIVVENYVPGTLEKFGLDYESVKSLNEKLIYCSISGFGQTGPYAKRAGFDVIVAAIGGLVEITGPENGEPCKVGVAVTDQATGLYAYGAIMAALLHRCATGQGQYIECDLLSTQVSLLVNVASAYLNAGVEGKRYGTAHGSIVPYQAFPTADGYLVVGATNDDQFNKIATLLDLDHLLEDKRYATNPARVKHRVTLVDTLSTRFRSKTTNEWLEIFKGSKLAYGPINDMKDVFRNEQVLHSGMIQEMNHKRAGKIRVAASPVKFNKTETVFQCPPPMFAQDTDQILRDILKYNDDQIEALKDEGAVR
ncbi:succinate--hydroxymethylglutarate CoA-transferase-like [Lineus longissimus]|uniref:succinate--hydroxymethylglutarate CoA-transferase-like n=1 Tax=Lineus longissimus TaxID=88925 RepID=UPI002B4CD93F